MTGRPRTGRQRRELLDRIARARMVEARYCPCCCMWRPLVEFGRDECLACQSRTNRLAYERRKAMR